MNTKRMLLIAGTSRVVAEFVSGCSVEGKLSEDDGDTLLIDYFPYPI